MFENGGRKSGATQENRQRSYVKIISEEYKGGDTRGKVWKGTEKIRPYRHSWEKLSRNKVIKTTIQL